MVITVSCPSCSSSFPVDSNKIPAKGVNARCSTCGDIFRIDKPSSAPAAPPPPAPEPPPLPPPAVPRSAFYEELGAEETAGSLEEVEVVPPPSIPDMPSPKEAPAAPPPPPPPAPEPAAEIPATGDPGFRFGKRDPTDKAKRLARVLVSDMIMYNAERHATALENGTIQEDFEDEIDKSWKEFVDQVGPEIADGPGRDFWTEALNDILAKGERLF